MTALSTREFGADVLKAAAIVGVVFIHADGVFGNASWFHDVVGDTFRFGVPVFIALYVRFACKGMARRRNDGSYLRERFIRLLVQFATWSTIYAAITANWPSLTPLKFVTRHWGGNGWAGQFYFLVILPLTLMMPWLAVSGRWLRDRPAWLLFGGVVVYAGLTYLPLPPHSIANTFSDRPFFYWVPYAWLGIVLMDRAWAPPAHTLLLASVALIPIEHLWIRPPDALGSIYLMPSTFLATAALLTWAQTGVGGGRLPSSALSRVVSLLSANTLGIFVLNPMVILLERRCVAGWSAPTGVLATVGLPLAATVMALLPSLCITLLLKRTALGRRLVA